MDLKISKEIYSQLINGKYINKNIIEKITYVKIENVLYKELEINFNDYCNVYENIGFELINKNDYYYIKKDEIINETHIEKSQFKEYILMMIILEYMVLNKIDIKYLKDYNLGVEENTINNIFSSDNFKNILMLSEINHNNPIKTILEDRNILERNLKNKLVLTDIGNDLLKYISDIGETLIKEDNED